MHQSKNKVIQKLVDTPFMDFDSCYMCHSHNGPFVWVRTNITHQFVCENCYEKLKISEKPLG